MRLTGVADIADRAVDELSGGQLQRVWLACCLAQATGVLLLDEPTTCPRRGSGRSRVPRSPGRVATVLVVGLAASRGGWDSDRLVLIGVGVSAAAAALTTFVIVLTDPWNVGKALTWLSGSTYGRTSPQVAPVAVTLALAGPALWQAHRSLDLLAVDETRPGSSACRWTGRGPCCWASRAC